MVIKSKSAKSFGGGKKVRSKVRSDSEVWSWWIWDEI